MCVACACAMDLLNVSVSLNLAQLIRAAHAAVTGDTGGGLVAHNGCGPLSFC